MKSMTTMTIALAAALAGCALQVDPHAIEACTITDAVGGQPVEGTCEEACAGVDYPATFTGPTCSSSARASAFGNPDAASCHYITADDGTTGCCALVGHATDPRIPAGQNGLVFYACDGGGK